VLLGQFLGRIVAASVLFVGLRRELSFKVVSKILREITGYTLPLVPGRWVSHSSGYISRFFIYAGMGASENAILAITTKLAALLDFFCVAFRNAWLPLAMAYIGDSNSEQFYVRSLRVFMAGGVFSIFALTAVCKPILTILAPDSYGSAQDFVPIFLVAAVIGELDINLQLGNQISRKTHWISIASAFAFAINLAVLMSMTSRLGIYAAGIGMLAAFIFKALTTYFSAQHHYKIHYNKRSIVTFIASCAVLLILSVCKSHHWIADMEYFSLIGLLAVVLPWLTLASEDRLLIRIWGGDWWRWLMRRLAAASS
jgi:O-antigen/teichoic acid export membrane protein